MAAAHCRCAKIAPVFLCFSFCPSHSGSTVKIEMSYKTWQDANMWLPEGIWKRSCWFCNCRGSRHPSHFHPRKKRGKKTLKSWASWGMLQGRHKFNFQSLCKNYQWQNDKYCIQLASTVYLKLDVLLSLWKVKYWWKENNDFVPINIKWGSAEFLTYCN